jgi:hypothetical protein
VTLVVAVLALAVVLLAVLVAGLLRSHAAILRRLHELGLGLDDVDGEGGLPLLPSSDGGGEDGGEHRERLPALVVGDPHVPENPGRPEGDVVPGAAAGAAGGPPERPRGERAADLTGSGPLGETQAVRVSDVEHDTILAFLSSGCPTCGTFWEAFAGELSLPERTRLVVVTKGPEEESPHEVATLRPAAVPVVMSSQAWADYRVPGSPYVVHVQGRTGRIIGEGTGQDWEQVQRLFAQASGDRSVSGVFRGRRKARADLDREREVDRALLAAGITPGDERLYGRSDGAGEAAGDVDAGRR